MNIGKMGVMFNHALLKSREVINKIKTKGLYDA